MMHSRKIHFRKMHGLGNDFMLIDTRLQPVDPASLPIRQWADRHTGIGFDQLLLLMPSSKATVFCRIFNPDGLEAEQCGNGMRCVARYLYESGQASADSLTIETLGGIVQANLRAPDRIEVILGVPIPNPGWLTLSIPVYASPLRVFSVSLGNPHVILQVDSLKDFPVGVIGHAISTHEQFPGGVNAGFVQRIDSTTIALRTFERGAGETLACGSNACAAAVAGICQHELVSPVTVLLEKGSLQVSWKGSDTAVRLVGDASSIYEGSCVIG